jgi:hypothetical protein
MPTTGHSAAVTPGGGTSAAGYVALQIPGSGFWALQAGPNVALLLGNAPGGGSGWVGQSAAQTI